MGIKTLSKILVMVILLFVSTVSYAQAPYKSILEGEVHGSFNMPNCDVSNITGKYRLSTIVGEPTIYINIKWKNGSGSATDCLENENFHTFLNVYSNYSSSYYYILADGATGSIPDGDYTWGNNPLSGSPNWGELMIADPLTISPNQSSGWNFVTAARAKTIWQYGFRVHAIVFVDERGWKHYIKK